MWCNVNFGLTLNLPLSFVMMSLVYLVELCTPTCMYVLRMLEDIRSYCHGRLRVATRLSIRGNHEPTVR